MNRRLFRLFFHSLFFFFFDCGEGMYRRLGINVGDGEIDSERVREKRESMHKGGWLSAFSGQGKR